MTRPKNVREVNYDIVPLMKSGPLTKSQKQLMAVPQEWKARKRMPGEATGPLIAPMQQPVLQQGYIGGCNRAGADDHKQYKSLITGAEASYRRHHV